MTEASTSSIGSRTGWIKLAPFPSTQWNGSQIIKINETEFARCSSATQTGYAKDITSITASTARYVYKYNIDTNKWVEWIQYPHDLQHPEEIAAAFDESEQIFYIFTNKCLHKINTETKKLISSDKVSIDIGRCARSVIINHKFNVIGGLNNRRHLIWNNDKKDFDEIHTFSDVNGCLSQSGLIYMESTNNILSFGGHDEENEDMDAIYSYNIKLQKWRKLSQRLPQQLSCFACFLSEDENYIVILGGISGGVEEVDTDEIYILNTKTMEIVNRELLCPNTGMCKAVRMCDRKKMEMLTSGYIRCIWKSAVFSDIMYPPDELIRLMGCFCSKENVYFLDDRGHNWKIDLETLSFLSHK